MAAMHVRLEIGGTPLDLNLPVPSGPASLREMLPAVRELSNTFVGLGVDAMAAQGQGVSCRNGCAACCRQLVPIAPVEAQALHEVVDALPAERQAVVRARFETACSRLASAGFFDRLDAAATGPAADGVRALAETYFSLGIACPFLEDESCSIHDKRPIACREYLVTSAPERCSSAGGEGVDNVVHLLKVKEALLALDAQERGPGPPGFVPLIRALEGSRALSEAEVKREPSLWLDALFRRLHGFM